METNQVLDGDFPQNRTLDVEARLASGGKRFINYIIDRIASYVVAILVFVFIFAIDENALNDEEDLDLIYLLLVYGSITLYYSVMEVAFGKTLGKLITGTKVVTKDGHHPNFGNTLGRTLCRFIPFEPFSFLGNKAIGWHDSITNTRVINDK
ncbi:RDD family protein [Fulvivirgaceae bacterium BMA10]|uniref:RDD family protein n=1 Tax=Splendidivirga corallicola TaxID=3051826 RepID=A0ABT8KVE4_9BACT|nr:RDD family protein [Fulvivirgaceae bacterium BMA10]